MTLLAFKVWEPYCGERFAMSVKALDPDDAADMFLDEYDAADGYPSALMVRGPDGAVSLVDVETEYEPVHYTSAEEFVGPLLDPNAWMDERRAP